jgi:hypothetical protein
MTIDEEKFIVLPQRDEMLKRLLRVSTEKYLQEKLYPLILNYAGSEKLPEGIVMLLMLSIHDYCEGMPPMMSTILTRKVPAFIDALVDDEDVAREAKDFFAISSGLS